MPVGDDEAGPDPDAARHRIETRYRKDGPADIADGVRMGAVRAGGLSRLRFCFRLLLREGQADLAPLSIPQKRDTGFAARTDKGECADGIARSANRSLTEGDDDITRLDARPGRRAIGREIGDARARGLGKLSTREAHQTPAGRNVLHHPVIA